jgi:hypothetical protein
MRKQRDNATYMISALDVYRRILATSIPDRLRKLPSLGIPRSGVAQPARAVNSTCGVE